MQERVARSWGGRCLRVLGCLGLVWKSFHSGASHLLRTAELGHQGPTMGAAVTKRLCSSLHAIDSVAKV